MNEEIKKRFKTFGWNVGTVVLVALLNAVAANLGVLDMPEWLVLVLGSALGQLTKFLSNVKMGKVSGFK